MKIRITFKDPDGTYEEIQRHVRSWLKSTGLTEREIDKIADYREMQLYQQLDPWIKHSEYITVEFDLEAKTATVIKNDK